MANRFTSAIYPSHYQPKPWNYIIAAGQAKDQGAQQVIDQLEAFRTKFGEIQAVVPGDIAYLKNKEEDIYNTLQDAVKTDISDPVNYNKIQQKIHEYSTDPNIIYNIMPRTSAIQGAYKDAEEMRKNSKLSSGHYGAFQLDLQDIWNDPNSATKKDFTTPYNLMPDSQIQESLSKIATAVKDGQIGGIHYDRANGLISKVSGVQEEDYLNSFAAYLDANNLDEMADEYRVKAHNGYQSEFSDYLISRLQPLAQSLAHEDTKLMNWTRANQDAIHKTNNNGINPLTFTQFINEPSTFNSKYKDISVQDGKAYNIPNSGNPIAPGAGFEGAGPMQIDTKEVNPEISKEIQDFKNKHINENLTDSQALDALKQLETSGQRNYNYLNSFIPTNLNNKLSNVLYSNRANLGYSINGNMINYNDLISQLGFKDEVSFRNANHNFGILSQNPANPIMQGAYTTSLINNNKQLVKNIEVQAPDQVSSIFSGLNSLFQGMDPNNRKEEVKSSDVVIGVDENQQPITQTYTRETKPIKVNNQWQWEDKVYPSIAVTPEAFQQAIKLDPTFQMSHKYNMDQDGNYIVYDMSKAVDPKALINQGFSAGYNLLDPVLNFSEVKETNDVDFNAGNSDNLDNSDFNTSPQ